MTAAADTAPKRLVKQSGDLCTAEEVANPPKETYRGRTLKTRVCRTPAEWAMIRAKQADYDRDWARYRSRMAGGSTGEGDPLPTPLRRN
jgi:hypothetical protein